MSRFVAVDRDTAYLLPPSVDDWLPADHLARFVVEVIEQLDLSDLTRQYAGRGSAAHHPAVLLGLLIYGYASGVHSSRKIERATFDSVAFRYVAANTHPDHDTLATFRRRFLKEVEALFVQVLVLAREMKLLKLGHIALDGTKITANASKHKALSWGHASKIEAQLREQVQGLLALADHGTGVEAVPIDAVHRAVRLTELLIPHAEAAFALMGAADGETDAQMVLAYILRHRLLTVIGSGELIYYWPMWPMLGTAIPVILGWINGGGRAQRTDEQRALPPSVGDDLR